MDRLTNMQCSETAVPERRSNGYGATSPNNVFKACIVTSPTRGSGGKAREMRNTSHCRLSTLICWTPPTSTADAGDPFRCESRRLDEACKGRLAQTAYKQRQVPPAVSSWTGVGPRKWDTTPHRHSCSWTWTTKLFCVSQSTSAGGKLLTRSNQSFAVRTMRTPQVLTRNAWQLVDDAAMSTWPLFP